MACYIPLTGKALYLTFLGRSTNGRSVLSRFNVIPPMSGPGFPGNFSGFPPGFPHFPPNKPILPSTKAGIAVGAISLVVTSFTGLYFLIRCLRRREQRKQANAIREISKPQEYPKIPPKANRVLGQDLETGKAAILQSQEIGARVNWGSDADG
jgi:hypothetical protein